MKKNFLITFLILISLPYFIWGQIKTHKIITTSDGLVNGQVRDIFEDSKGYIWFATNGGVSRWDGNKFLNFTEANGLTSSFVFDITEGDDGTIYFANFGMKGVTTFKEGNLDTLFAQGNNKLSFLTLIHFTQDSSLLMCAADGVNIFKNKTLINLNELYDIPSAAMHALAENSKGEVFITTEDGILKVSGNKLETVFGYDSSKTNFVNVIGINKKDELFFTNEKQFLVIKENNISVVSPELNYLGSTTDDIQFSSNNTAYLATQLGLGILSPNGKLEILTKENGLSNNQQYKLLISKNGTIYSASSIADVNIFNHGRLENYSIQSGLPSDNIFNIYVDKTGTKYISTSDGLLIENSKIKKTVSANARAGYNSFISFAEQGDGKVYLGTTSGIDIVEDGKITELVKFNPTKHMKHQESNEVFSLVKFNDSTLLAGTYRGVYKIINNRVTHIQKKDGLLSDYVSKIIVTKDKSIVYGYHGKGLSVFKDNTFNHYTVENGLSNNSILDLYQRSDGAILVGTQQAGLNIIKNGTIDTLTVDDGLTSNEIRTIAEDKLGNVYLTTPKGLNILRFSENGFTLRTITKEDGLVGNDCSKNALFVDEGNNVWIGTSNGLSKYNPKFDKTITTAPQVYITGLNIFNKPFSLEKFREEPELNYDENYLDFVYTGLNIPNNHKTVYKYRMNGVDKEWVTSKEIHVQYTSLDDGKYTFEVKAKNEWGYWSEPTKLSFVINPAWWETWWFYTLTIIAIGSLIAFVSSYRYRHLLSIEKMRSKISADLHDSIGSGLSEISILSELLGAQMPDDKKDYKSSLGNISNISRTLIESMSDIVWLVNPQKDTLRDLFKRLQMSYHEVLKYSDVDLYVENLDELETIKLPMNFRQHLYLIFKEAINNAIKYSEADLLNLKIKTSGNNLTVIFSDNGKGFKFDENKMGNGLINMKRRAKEIGGIIEYISEISKGTTVKFSGKFQKQKSSFI